MTTWLSQNFTLEEMCKSSTAIKNGWDNTPSPNYINNLRLLCAHVLQPIRTHFNLPVTVSSGFRSANLNRAMGGSNTSQHMFGQAADIEIKGVANYILWQFIADNLSFDQVIAEYLEINSPSAGWIHVSYKSSDNRGQTLSCVGPGRYVTGLQYV